MTTIERAIQFAKVKHGEQKRKYTGEPYINHPIAVADLVANVTKDEDMIVASILHDVVEDTNTTLSEIEQFFGNRVSTLVSWVTDVSLPKDGNRATRKAIDREHIRKAPPEAKTIKLADLIDNTSSIVKYDKDFAKVYMEEKFRLLPYLVEGDNNLWIVANMICDSYFRLETK